jgi:hypothetical protein
VRPVFVKHFFLGDQDDVTAEALALAYEVAAFEIGGETDNVEWASFVFWHVAIEVGPIR